MRNDYRVLSKGPLDGPWDLATLRENFVRGGFNGLNLRFSSPPPLKDLDFLTDYEGLEYLEVTGNISNDLAAFRLPNLRELLLLTKSSRKIPGFTSPNLVRLGFDDRPGRDLVSNLSSLQELMVWRWRGTDIRFLGSPPPPIKKLRIDGMRQLISLHGIEECLRLTDLEVRESRVEGLGPMSSLVNLERIRIFPAYRAKGDTCLDLAELLPLKKLKQLNLIYVGAIRSLWPLLQMPSLRDLRLGDVEISDGDLSPLYELPSYVEFNGQLAERIRRKSLSIGAL